MDDLGFSTPFATVNGGFGVDFAEMNKGVQPLFFTVTEPDPAASEREGMAKYRVEERVHLIVAGDPFNVSARPVDEDIKNRFPEHYARWLSSKQAKHIEGTPLKQWPLLTLVQIAEFEAANVFSVEMLAELADANVNRVPEGRIWREKAKAWLAQAKDGATATRLAAENERLREMIDNLEKRVADVEAAEKRSPGRPPRQAA